MGPRANLSATSLAVAAPPDEGPSRRWLAGRLAAPLAALLLAELDQSVFATALPTVVGELGGWDRLPWVNAAYLLTATLVMPVVGGLGDRWGRRRVFLVAVGVLVLGSALGGLAPNLPVLIVARALQGLGGGGLLVLVQALVADLVPARRRAPVLSGVGAVFALAALLGPVLGGGLTSTVGWRWAFWMNVPIGLAAFVVAAVLLDRDRAPRRGRFDTAGAVVLAITVTALTVLLTGRGWSPILLVVLIAAAAGGLVLLLAIERRSPDPLLPLRLLADRTVLAVVVAGTVLGAVAFGLVSYLPTWLQLAHGLSPVRSGLQVLALVAGLGLATVTAAQVARRTGRVRPIATAGCLGVAAALALLASLGPAAGPIPLSAALFLLGAGIGCAWDVLVVLLQTRVPADRVGRITATNGFLRESGVLVGTAAIGAVLVAALHRRLPALGSDALAPERVAALPPAVRAEVVAAYASAFSPVFLALAPLALLAAAALVLLREPT